MDMNKNAWKKVSIEMVAKQGQGGKMVHNNVYGGRALRIAVGIMVLVLMMAGGAGATKFIRNDATGGDCTSFGTWNVESMTCTMAADLTENIQIDSNGVTFDGNGHTITGSGTEGVYLSGRSGVTIKNMNIQGFSEGVTLSFSNNNYLIGNNVTNITKGTSFYFGYGFFLGSSNNNMIRGNNVSNNDDGITLYGSDNNTLSGNTANSNKNNGIFLRGDNNTLSGNTANSNKDDGIFLSGSNNTLRGNTANLNQGVGIYLSYSNNNTLNNNNANSNIDSGIYLYHTNYNTLIGNNASKNNYGINLYAADNDTLIGNNASENNFGFYLDFCKKNILKGNIANSNYNYGIYLDPGWYGFIDNSIYNNYFNNTENYGIHKFGVCCINSWNTTKTSTTNIIAGSYLGGNFWAHPNGTGFSQTCTDSNFDGLCDLKYILNNENIDYLPLKYQAVPPKITVVSPNGGENWTRGTTQLINWTSIGSPESYVKIELLKSGVTNTVIIASTLNDGSYPWLIPVAQVPGTVYTIKITNTTNAAFNDISDSTFTIPDPTITVVSPNGTESWVRGTTQTIKWNSSGSPGTYVKIELLKGGVFNRTIIASTPNDGTHPWPILATQAAGTDYQVKITSTSNASYNGTSDNSFTIPGLTSARTLNVGKDQAYSTIQSAIDAAKIGDMIMVGEGTYNENLRIKTNGISILGKNKEKTIIKGEKTISGIMIDEVNNVSISGFTIWNSGGGGQEDAGITIYKGNGNTVSNMNIILNSVGVSVFQANNNVISGNNIESNFGYGIYIYASIDNKIFNNNIKKNQIGIYAYSAKTNLIYSNNLIENKNQAYDNTNTNLWDNGYPSGGNYWGDYIGIDLRSGSSQNIIGSDGIGDTPYNIIGGGGAKDRYPMMARIVPPIITVVSPNGGENWTRGTTQTIKWNSSGSPGAYVKIELLKPGVANKVIIASTPNDGTHPWPILATQAPGNDYIIKITSTTNVVITDNSDSTFTIPDPTITVVSPNDTESWVRGTTQTIRWNSSGSPGAYVKIELLKAGILNRTIIASTPNDGIHPWLILATQAPGTDYKVRITSTANSSYNDTSDNSFTIPVPSIKVVSPNGPENWTRGTTQTIRWNSTESPGTYVKIELLKGGNFSRTIIASTLNDGSHPWPILATQAPGTDYQVRITSTANISIKDTSDNNFTIPVPSITVKNPNGGESWIRGTTRIINWSSTESPGTYVKIELLKGGNFSRTIIASTLNDGSHPWPILATQAPGTDYQVRITSTANISVRDTSDNNFTIPVPSMTVTTPNGGENWSRGTTQTIKWNSTESPKSYVKIELLKAGVLNRVIIASTLNDGSQSWLIPSTQLIGSDYKIRINSTINPAITDSGDNNFNITG